MTHPKDYIVEKDREWVNRWEAREQQFRKEIAELRAHYDEVIVRNLRLTDKLDRMLADQQRVILKIREIPFVGERVVRWAGYTD